MKQRIIVVDDDWEILNLVKLNLAAEGFEVDLAEDGETAMEKIRSGGYHMMILDLMLPGIDGFEVARLVRQVSDLPILMLSAKDTDTDKAVGLGVGADDYLTKPFSPVELIARVKAHLRRYLAASRQGPAIPTGDQDRLEQGPVCLNQASRRAWIRDDEVILTAKEFDLLWLLVSHPGRVFTRRQIFNSVWGEDFLQHDDNTVMVHIRRLRGKIEADPGKPELIRTVWGIGYRFEGGN